MQNPHTITEAKRTAKTLILQHLRRSVCVSEPGYWLTSRHSHRSANQRSDWHFPSFESLESVGGCGATNEGAAETESRSESAG